MNRYLVFLDWPEPCFRPDAADRAAFRKLVPRGSRVWFARDEAAFLAYLPEATHAFVWRFPSEWFARAPRLKVLATPSAGRELVSQAAPPGVRIHFGGFHGAIMSESVAAFALAWARGFFRPETRRYWPRVALGGACFTVAGTRAVILGYGRIGRAIGDKLAALGVEVFGWSRHLRVPAATLRAKLRAADWVILALPGDTGTDNLVDAALLRRLKPQCVLVNVGRGNAVDETALLAALDAGRLAGAYLDVFRNEPRPFRARRWNLIRMPHVSACASDYLRRFFGELKDEGLL